MKYTQRGNALNGRRTGHQTVLGAEVLLTILLFCLCAASQARTGATLFVGEPYGYDGAFAGTGHAAIYLSGVCAASPVVLRLCAPGETGIVLSRYRGVGGYDWIAIPLIPYLYAVERVEDVPLLADKKLVAFLRDRYRRNHLEALIPDQPDGGTPDGAWYQLIGASYLRTIYAFEIETRPEQDGELIRMLNDRSNRQHWKLVSANCADFARQIINFYHPHSVHRSIIGDLGVTTPKQVARTLSEYSHHHPELQGSRFVIPQVPGTMPRSKRIRGVFEVMLTSKKYMLPILLFHPYAAGAAVAVYVGHWHFNLGKGAPILDAKNQLVGALTTSDRRVLQERLNELTGLGVSATSHSNNLIGASLHAAAMPALDDAGGLVLQLHVGAELTSVGITRSNILNPAANSEFAIALVQARLREEMKPCAAKKTARTDVESDLTLLQQLLNSRPDTAVLASESGALSEADTR